jgi:hypothetical protein
VLSVRSVFHCCGWWCVCLLPDFGAPCLPACGVGPTVSVRGLPARVCPCVRPSRGEACVRSVRSLLHCWGRWCVCLPSDFGAHLRVYEIAARTPAPARARRSPSRWCGGRAAAAAAACCARGNVPSGLNNSRASASCAPAGTPAFACLCVSPSRGGVSGRGGACDGGRAIDCVRAHPALTWHNRWRASGARVSTAPRVRSGGTP